MQKKPTSVGKPKQLLVEGQDEERFFDALLNHLKIDDIEVKNYGGKHKLKSYLDVFVNVSSFDQVQSIGIVRDADDNAASAFQSVQDSLSKVNLAVSKEVLAPADDSLPKVTVFIMPGHAKSGALEDLCLSALKDDPATPCVAEFMQCVKQSVLKVPHNEAKARMHVFLASRKDPELRIGEAAQRGYLPWSNAAFTQLIEFVRGV